MRPSIRTALMSFIFVLTSTAVQATEFAVEQLSNGLLVTADKAYVGASLRLVGPDGHQMLTFGAGEDLFIPTPGKDGRYKFELVLSPVLDSTQRAAVSSDPRTGFGPGTGILRRENVMSTGFMVSGGVLVDWGIEENTAVGKELDGALKDQVIADDLIVNGGSLCVGFDCVNGENFGADTTRLKENNLRIHFQDTSGGTGSFPSQDWRLIANDQTNGGQNYFAIQDATTGRVPFRVEGDAAANTLYVDNAERVGINTSTPAVELHIIEGNTPTIRVQQDGSSGFQAQIFDVAVNEANFFVRDVTNGSALVMRIQPGADSNSLTIDNEGQVGIGVPGAGGGIAEKTATLQVRSRGVAGDAAVRVQDSAGSDLMVLADSGDMALTGTLAQLSRRDSKEGFEDLDSSSLLQSLRELPISRWNYIHQPDEQKHLGPMAEDFYAAYGLGNDPERIATSDMAAVALASTQALLKEIDQRDAQINELEQRIADLERLMLTVMMEKEQEDSQVASR